MKRLKYILLGLGLAVMALTGVTGAAAQDDSGTGDEGQTYTSQLVQVDTSNFPQIDVWVSVTDADGNPVRTLPDSAFQLIENGQPIEIQEVYQAGEQGPVTTVLVMDRSGSMLEGDKLEEARQAARAFVDLMRPEDQTGLVIFNTEVQVAQPITGDQAALRQAIDQVEAFNDTALNDAIIQAVDLLGDYQGRKAIIVLSDGMDNRSTNNLDAILSRLSDAEISIYTIGLGNPEDGTIATSGINEEALQAIADRSNGSYLFTPQPARLSELYQQISQRLHNEYRIRYTTPQGLRNGIERRIDVQITEGTTTETGYNPGGVIPETAEQLSWPVFGGIMAGMAILLLIPGALKTFRRKPRKKSRVKLKEPPATQSRKSVRLKDKSA